VYLSYRNARHLSAERPSVVGGAPFRVPLPSESVVLERLYGYKPSERLEVFHRLALNKKISYSRKYTRVTKRNSYTVQYMCVSSGSDRLFYFIKLIIISSHQQVLSCCTLVRET